MNDVQRGYLSDLLVHIDKIIRYTESGREAFFASEMEQDAVLRNFIILGEMSNDSEKNLPITIRISHGVI
ncbi:MAG: DUF86 domain-containing protein [Anaerolineae bacterium]|jgi:uncharacterized protein with HEPN domain|nr:DUF86 domain-containing protein [Anaerolineae bacterium]